jgi:glyoxylase-like metal-dependent hydrolase (beta-lactamase superfamily II)
MKPDIEQYISAQGTRIYRIPLSLFPGMDGFAHLIVQGVEMSLFDVGSGFGDSNQELEAGLNEIAHTYGEDVHWDRIANIFISHGHIDHYGGLHFVRERTNAPIIIHELERRILTDYEQRLNLIANRLEEYLVVAGLPEADREEVMALYLLHKLLFSSIEVQGTYEGIGMQSGGIMFEHVPGHCPGQVIAWVDDILLSGDHILKETSPHQAPESLSLNMGLEHYLNSLAQVLPRAHQARWTLGGHEGPIEDLAVRVFDIAEVHRERLKEILGLLDQPMSLFEISNQLFPKTEGYHRVLALEEAGAHMEYLNVRGYISFTQDKSQVRRYSRLGDMDPPFPGFHVFSKTFHSAQTPDLSSLAGVKSR